MSKKIDIFALYLSNYHQFLTGREIARKCEWNHQTALPILTELVNEGLLKKTIQGKNYLYTPNLDRFEVIQYIMLAEQMFSLKRLEQFEIKKIVESIIPHCETIIIFGSFAKSSEKEDSDVDIIIINATSKNEIEKIKKRFPRDLSIEYSSWKKFTTSVSQHNSLSIEIIKNHLLFGNSIPFINIVKYFKL